MQIDVQLTEAEWQSQETPAGTLLWRGFPDSVEDLSRAIAAAAATGHADVTAAAGHWTAILRSPSGVILAQDSIRSWPLFIATDEHGKRTVTDQIDRARQAAGDPDRDDAAALEFLQLGYVTGGDTLFTRVAQLQAGEWRKVTSETNERLSGALGLQSHAAPGVTDVAELDAVFTGALDAVFDRLFARIGDRQVVIPLSGGLDSRLLAIALRERGHQNVVNFTYGVGRTREVAISEEVAAALGQRWEFIQYSNEEIRAAWQSPAAAEFIAASYAGASLPHIQDWYPVAELRRRGLIADDAVFLPGHTVVGNMHDEEILVDPQPMSRAALTDVLLHHHATIQPNHDALRDSPRFATKLAEFLDGMQYNGSPASRLDTLESWNIVERQTKYINHSVRGYEHHGYEWALPMLDRELLDVWARFDLSVAQDREWYRGYVDRRYTAASGQSAPTFEAFAAANVSKSNRDRVKAVLRGLGLLRRVERGITANAYAQHPMGFQEFVGDATPAEVRKFILRGGLPMGIYTQKFLDDSWNPHTRIFRGQRS